MSKTPLRDLTAEQLTKRVARAAEHLQNADDELGDLFTLTDAERRSSDGRLREGEATALAAVLDAAERRPSAFDVLGNKDGGTNPAKFETVVLRDQLQRAVTLDGLATALEELARDVRDTQLVLGGDVRRVLLAAYEIAKPLAKHDEAVRSALAPATNFYATPARLAAKTRAERKGSKPE